MHDWELGGIGLKALAVDRGHQASGVTNQQTFLVTQVTQVTKRPPETSLKTLPLHADEAVVGCRTQRHRGGGQHQDERRDVHHVSVECGVLTGGGGREGIKHVHV